MISIDVYDCNRRDKSDAFVSVGEWMAVLCDCDGNGGGDIKKVYVLTVILKMPAPTKGCIKSISD